MFSFPVHKVYCTNSFFMTIIVFMFLNKRFININLKNVNYTYKVYI